LKGWKCLREKICPPNENGGKWEGKITRKYTGLTGKGGKEEGGTPFIRRSGYYNLHLGKREFPLTIDIP